jgi:protease IV
MRFAKAIWKLLVGVKDALVLLFMLLFFGALYIGLSARPEPVGEGVLALDLDGVVVEQPSRADLSELVAGSPRMKEYRLRDLVRALETAKEDDRVKAVALDLEGFLGGGQTAMATLSDAVRSVREAGKPVIAYSVGYTDDSYQLAAAASEVWLNPLGLVAIAGPGGQNLYFAGMLEKLGVTPHVYRVGTYKAAVEPFTRSDMSPEAEQNAQALGQALLQTWVDHVGRTRPKANLEPYIRNTVAAVDAAGGDMARAALAAGLIDRIADRQAFQRRLAQLGGKDRLAPEGYRKIRIESYIREQVPEPARGSIGVVTVAGTIIDGKAPPGTAGGESIAEAIERGLGRQDLRALVVRVDSPGGSVLASERIRQAILEAKRRKLPVVVSMGNVAASGGYWIATPADFIFAEPSTVTGSIGVFGILPSFEGTREKLGLGADGIKTTPLSGEPNILSGPSPEANRLLQAGVESTYRRFLAIVAQSRKKTPAEIDRIAQGRVWDGGTARQLGLVDGFGGLEEAIGKAAELAKLDRGEVQVTFLERPVSFRQTLLEMLVAPEETEAGPADAFAVLGGELRLADALHELKAILSGPRIQVRCLECPSVAPPRLDSRDMSLLGMIRELLF